MILSPAFCWFLAGTAFFVLELALPGFIIFFFGIGAWTTALAAYFLEVSVNGQLLLFLVVSLVSLLLLRNLLNTIFAGTRKEEDEGIQTLPVGATAEVIQPIKPPAEGRIKYGGSLWLAVSREEIQTGEVVEILGQDGLLIRVKPIGSRERTREIAPEHSTQ